MTILRSGSNKKYSENWTKAFGGASKKKSTKSKTTKKPTKKTNKKSTRKK